MNLRAVWALPGIEPRRPCPADLDQILTEVSHSREWKQVYVTMQYRRIYAIRRALNSLEGLCYIKNLNKCCVTGNKRLDSSRHDLKFPMHVEWSSVMLNEMDSEHTSTNGMIRVLSLIYDS